MVPSFYQNLIHSLRPAGDINPAGVEASMRLQYSTLDHLPRETFVEETELAAAMERDTPGALRRLACSYGMEAEFDHWHRRAER